MVVRSQSQNLGIVLAHHGVLPTTDGLNSIERRRHVSQDFLRAQLQQLREQGFEFVSLSSLVHQLLAGKITGRQAAISFDDGLYNVVEFGAPVLREFNAKACIFAVAQSVLTGQPQWTDVVEKYWAEKHTDKCSAKTTDLQPLIDFKKTLRNCTIEERDQRIKQIREKSPTVTTLLNKALTTTELRQLDSEVFEIGCHSFSHPSLRQMTSPEILHRELVQSKLTLEAACGRDITLYAYPFGEYDQAMKREIETAGYKAAFSVTPGEIAPDADVFELRRFEWT